jgi:hypothetical protein
MWWALQTNRAIVNSSAAPPVIDDCRRMPPPSHLSLEENKDVTIVVHLTRMYGKVLLIAPVSMFLAFKVPALRFAGVIDSLLETLIS